MGAALFDIGGFREGEGVIGDLAFDAMHRVQGGPGELANERAGLGVERIDFERAGERSFGLLGVNLTLG